MTETAEKKSFFQTVCALAIPVALQSMLQASFSIVDQIMIGQLGSVSIAGVGLAGKFSSVYSVIVSALGTVAGIMISQYMGQENRREVKRSFTVNLLFMAALACVFTLLCALFPVQIMGLYSKDRDAVAAADPDNCQGVMTAGFALGEDVGQKVSRTVERLDFNSDYYLKACAGSYSGKYAAASSIVKVSTGSNNPPVIYLGQEGDFTLQSYMKTEIPINITDPDGHAITVSYTAGSAADALVQSDSGAYSIGMDCLKTEPGTYTAHISVTDEYGASSSKDFTYTILENHAPEVVNECAGFVLENTGKAVSADLTGYISDPDGEIPVFEAVSSDKQKIYAAVDGQTLTCTSLAYGICDVTVKATDARGLTCTMSFKVGVPDPSVPVLVYPSQVRDYLNISTGMAATAKVTIRTSAGNSVYSASEEVSCIRPLAVDMRECAPGRYSVRIETGGKEYVRNIVKL